LKFFFDNNLPPRLAQAVNALLQPEHSATHLQALFRDSVSDMEWIGKLGEEGNWIVISGDQRIVKNQHERKAWQAARLTTFFLKKGWTNQELWAIAAQLIRWWPAIMKQAEIVVPGAAFIVQYNYNGRFEQLMFPS
jgi:hypothetical protein